MIVANVKDLKARLNRYLRLVEDGKTVLVTRRGRGVAQLRPAPKRSSRPSIEEIMIGLAEQGLVDLPKRVGPVGLNPGIRVRDPEGAEKVLEEWIAERKRR